ncbi:MAG TPA: hypothetical protein VF996_00945 [Candidatus Saccharimonadales bacterium]|jgi:hypothetical protein
MHKVDRTRWQELNILEQMANIYSEVGRTLAAQGSGNKERAKLSLGRALDLFDATIEGLAAKNKSSRLKEVLRAKEQFLEAHASDNKDDKSSIENYFMQFALAARNGR